ncbi:MAG: succinylglutamate desuccinylase/aspartoacylase family protein, partial [Deinococcus sp.]|nr:succinylglutamate desuccinylase/aspartoacylase family protein [Deinococcus sp.]
QALRLAVGTSPDGAEYWVPVWALVGRRRRPQVTVTAGVHGDEFEGMRALMQLAQELAPEHLHGSVVLAPMVNPTAFRAGTRPSPVDGLNLNRLFPGSPTGAPSERLAHRLMEGLVQGSDLLVDLHSGGTRLLHAPLSGYYPLPGEVGRISQEAALATGLPYVWNLPQRPGVLSFEAARAGIPATGAEIGGSGRCLGEDVARYRQAVLGVLGYMKILRDAPRPSRHAPVVSGDWLLAAASGFFEPTVTLEQPVKKGQVLGQVLDPFGTTLCEVKAPRAGIVLGLRSFPTASAGDLAVFAPWEGEEGAPPASSI